MKTIKVDAQCESCGGTGIYQGFAEHDGIGVVCRTCDGTGCQKIEVKYIPFESKKSTRKIKWVLLVNPGISVGTSGSKNLKPQDFGGMPYDDWAAGNKFLPKSEMRNYSCPAWWYQCADYDLKPEWDECICCGSFSACKNFHEKSKCWERWDKEHPRG